MKVYLGIKKDKNKALYGITIYGNDSRLIYSDTRYFDISNTKFGNIVELLHWGADKLKALGYNGKISMEEKLLIVFNSSTVYNWLDKEKAPRKYIIPYHNMLSEWNFVPNAQEFIYSPSANKRVLFTKTTKEEKVNIRDLFAQ